MTGPEREQLLRDSMGWLVIKSGIPVNFTLRHEPGIVITKYLKFRDKQQKGDRDGEHSNL